MHTIPCSSLARGSLAESSVFLRFGSTNRQGLRECVRAVYCIPAFTVAFLGHDTSRQGPEDPWLRLARSPKVRNARPRREEACQSGHSDSFQDYCCKAVVKTERAFRLQCQGQLWWLWPCVATATGYFKQFCQPYFQ